MPDQVKKPFVLNDETVTNSYGFRVLNAGINLERFIANPVILAQHYNSVWTVIGRWENVRVEGKQLLADPVFDEEDPDSAVVAGKVKRGFLKGASIGFIPDENDTDFNFVKGVDGVPELHSCELLEASVVAIPSNRQAIVKMYNRSEEPISETEIKLSLKSIETFFKTDMKELKLSVATLLALKLDSTENPILVAAAIETMVKNHDDVVKKLETATAKITELSGKVTEFETAKSVELVDGAINAKRLGADQREAFLKLAQTDFASAKALIDGMTPRTDLGGNIKNPKSTGEVKTMDDFQKLSLADQLAFKNDKPEEYKKLFNA